MSAVEHGHLATPALAPDAIWGIGRWVDAAGDAQLWPVSGTEIGRDAEIARRRLAAHGIGPGDVVLVTSVLSDAIQVGPIERGVRALGAVCCTADATWHDAHRVASLLEQFSPRAVIGVSDLTLDGLVESNRDVAGLFGLTSLVIAQHSARARLAGFGVATSGLAFLGPAVGIECPAGVGLHVGAEAWDLSVEGGSLHVTGRAPRATAFDHVDTGWAGTLSHDRCSCGSDDPRFLPEGRI